MANRNFGPTLGAGIRVQERTAAKQIVASALGVACLVGVFERGTVGRVVYAASDKQFARKLGGRVGVDATTGAAVTPDAAQDYWLHGQGAGELVCVRVTDGNEIQSDLVLYSRGWGTAFGAATSLKDSQSQIKIPVMRIKAKDGGRWGGRKVTRRAAVASTGSIGTTTLTTGLTMLADEYKGATLELDAVSGKTYTVISNSTAGVLTLETGTNLTTDRGANTDLGYSLTLGVKTLSSGIRKGLAAKIKPGVANPSSEFGLDVYVDGERRIGWSDLSMDPASARHFATVINDDLNNQEVTVTDLWASSTPLSNDVRPANFYGMPMALSGTAGTVQFQPLQVVSVSDSKIAVVDVDYDASYEGVPVGLVFTWVNASNHYTVAATGLFGRDTVANLPNFSVGSSEQLHKQYNPGATHAKWLKWIPKITIDHTGSAPADGATFAVKIHPLPTTQLVGGAIAPDAKTYPGKTLRIRTATFDTVTVDGNPATLGLAPVQAVVTGTVAEGAGYAITGSTNDKLKIAIDARKAVTVTLTAGATQTAQDIVDDINGAFDTAFGVGNLRPASVYTDTAGAKYVRLTSAWYEGGGASSVVDVQTQATSGYSALGLTVATTTGTNGKESDLQFAAEATGGYDGAAPADADYIDALAIATSPINRVPHSKGVMLLATPDVTSTTVQQAGEAYAAAKAHVYLVQTPVGTTDEADAVTYATQTIGRGEDAATYFPSYYWARDPDASGSNKLVPACGAVMGLWAKQARESGHYARPAAGIGAELVRLVKLPTEDRTLDGEILNPQGLNVLKYGDSATVVWGARTLAGVDGEKFLSKRLQLSHYVHVLLADGNFDSFVFELNDRLTWAQLRTRLRTYFAGEFARRALGGATFDDACQIKVDAENNTDATIATGDMNAEISLFINGFAERVVFTLGKMGVTENVSA